MTPTVVEHEGESRTITEWAGLRGMQYTTLKRRLKCGWPVERALREVVRPTNTGRSRAEREAQWRARRPTILRAQAKAYRESERGCRTRQLFIDKTYADPTARIRRLVRGTVRRSIRKGMAYSQGLLDALLRDVPVQCPCCRRLIDYSRSARHDKDESAASIDRVDNAVGYTVANSVIICRRCNRMKGSATLADVVMIQSYIEQNTQQDQFAQSAHERGEVSAERSDERAETAAERAARRELQTPTDQV